MVLRYLEAIGRVSKASRRPPRRAMPFPAVTPSLEGKGAGGEVTSLGDCAGRLGCAAPCLGLRLRPL